MRPSILIDVGLWELPVDILTDIEQTCRQVLQDCRNKGSNAVDKFRITLEQVEGILWDRAHPGGLIRRTDFVPISTFNPKNDLITPETMFQAAFGIDEVSWLTTSVDLPAVPSWPGHALDDFDLKSLLCLFARAMKDSCFASIRLGPVVSIHEARLNEGGILRIMDPAFKSRASVYKGRLVWVAEHNALVQALRDAWDDEEEQWIAPFGLGSFCSNFYVGSLHVVESMDVTNSKMKLRPPLRPEGAKFVTELEEPADAPMDLPGVGHDAAQIETRFVCSLTNYCLTMVSQKIQAPCHAMIIHITQQRD